MRASSTTATVNLQPLVLVTLEAEHGLDWTAEQLGEVGADPLDRLPA